MGGDGWTYYMYLTGRRKWKTIFLLALVFQHEYNSAITVKAILINLPFILSISVMPVLLHMVLEED